MVYGRATARLASSSAWNAPIDDQGFAPSSSLGVTTSSAASFCQPEPRTQVEDAHEQVHERHAGPRRSAMHRFGLHVRQERHAGERGRRSEREHVYRSFHDFASSG
jgi:hypothetical protein